MLKRKKKRLKTEKNKYENFNFLSKIDAVCKI